MGQEDLTPVSVQLSWVEQAQFAGYYVARDKGYFATGPLDYTSTSPWPLAIAYGLLWLVGFLVFGLRAHGRPYPWTRWLGLSVTFLPVVFYGSGLYLLRWF